MAASIVAGPPVAGSAAAPLPLARGWPRRTRWCRPWWCRSCRRRSPCRSGSRHPPGSRPGRRAGRCRTPPPPPPPLSLILPLEGVGVLLVPCTLCHRGRGKGDGDDEREGEQAPDRAHRGIRSRKAARPSRRRRGAARPRLTRQCPPGYFVRAALVAVALLAAGWLVAGLRASDAGVRGGARSSTRRTGEISPAEVDARARPPARRPTLQRGQGARDQRGHPALGRAAAPTRPRDWPSRSWTRSRRTWTPGSRSGRHRWRRGDRAASRAGRSAEVRRLDPLRARALERLDPERGRLLMSATDGQAVGPRAAAGEPQRHRELQVRLDYPLPGPARGGRAAPPCSYAAGASARVLAIRSLTFVVDGEVQPVMAQRMPRADVFKALHPGIDPYARPELDSDPGFAEDPELRSFRSGFWGLVRLGRGPAGGERELLLRATPRGRQPRWRPSSARIAIDGALADAGGRPGAGAGRRAVRGDLHGHLRPAAGAAPAPARLDPRADASQLGLRDQRRLLEPRAASRPSSEAVAGRPALRRSRARRGGCTSTTTSSGRSRWPRAAADYVAMADQDDFWHPDKLETLLAEIGSAQLVYSDARIIDRDGELIADTYWSMRRNNHDEPLVAADGQLRDRRGLAVPARAARLRAALPAAPVRALPRPLDRRSRARCSGDIAFVDRPLYDYVQHGGAVLGHAGANWMPPLRDRLGWLKKDPQGARAQLAAALLRGLLPADAVHDHPRDALRPSHDRRPAPRARRGSRARSARRSRWPTSPGGRARELRRRAGDARRRDRAVLRVRLAAPRGGGHRRARAPPPAPAHRRPPADDARCPRPAAGIPTTSPSAPWPPRSRRSSWRCATTPRSG